MQNRRIDLNLAEFTIKTPNYAYHPLKLLIFPNFLVPKKSILRSFRSHQNQFLEILESSLPSADAFLQKYLWFQ